MCCLKEETHICSERKKQNKSVSFFQVFSDFNSSNSDVNNVLWYCCLNVPSSRVSASKFSRKSSSCRACRRWRPNRKWPRGSGWGARRGIGCWPCANGRESTPQTLHGRRTRGWSSYLESRTQVRVKSEFNSQFLCILTEQKVGGPSTQKNITLTITTTLASTLMNDNAL